MNFNHSHGCQKCTTIGEYFQSGHHMSFPKLDAPLRTNEDFRSRKDEEHHKGASPLEKLDVDMVKDVIIADSLHLFDLGVMRKCLKGWCYGNFNFKNKWSAQHVKQISATLMTYNPYMPKEIHRSIRGFDCLNFWKGNEYRTFLYYLGIVVLKDNLSVETYSHFIILFCAVTLCSSEHYLKYIDLATELFQEYVEKYIDLYGIDSIGSNIHNLIHVTEDVKRFGCLTKLSAYPFESRLGFIKHLLRHGNRPLEQICMRLIEQSNIKCFSVHNESKLHVKQKEIRNGSVTYNYIDTGKGFVLSSKKGDSWFLTTTNEIVQVLYITQENVCYNIIGLSIKKKKDFFSQPFSSSNINIYISDGQQNLEKKFLLSDIKCKIIALPYNNQLVFIPMVHTLPNSDI